MGSVVVAAAVDGVVGADVDTVLVGAVVVVCFCCHCCCC